MTERLVPASPVAARAFGEHGAVSGVLGPHKLCELAPLREKGAHAFLAEHRHLAPVLRDGPVLRVLGSLGAVAGRGALVAVVDRHLDAAEVYRPVDLAQDWDRRPVGRIVPPQDGPRVPLAPAVAERGHEAVVAAGREEGLPVAPVPHVLQPKDALGAALLVQHRQRVLQDLGEREARELAAACADGVLPLLGDGLAAAVRDVALLGQLLVTLPHELPHVRR
mmetsp:Transcript_52884/g.140938  ORF Transcript_52884/g.140938 Transcript_52884/m.140938 type:complete len:222 (+) Transcript_52884:1101-1766(+)